MNSTWKVNVRSDRQDVYTRITQKIIADLEHGVRPWLRPWREGHVGQRVTLPLRHCGTPYQGINILLLWGEAVTKGYRSNRWMTYRQACDSGAQVRKGEHGSLVVYADRITKTEQNDEGEAVEHEIPYLKGYAVFNVEQIEGLPENFYKRLEVGAQKLELIDAAEKFFAATGAIVRHGGDRAFYSPRRDVIQLPVLEAFRDATSYAATKAHELTHWTAHPSRLNRTLGKRFGDDAYAAEELIAELAAAFVCAVIGVTPEAREDNSAYIAHWVKVLKDDRRAIVTAAAHAQRAVDYLTMRAA